VPLFAIAWYDYTLNGILLFISFVMWLLILIQKGKGGGLAGAFGGAGGSSPFGSKAGDTFTKITLYLAAVWVLVIMINVKTMQGSSIAANAEPDTKQSEGTPTPE
jgi:preprotein translocase subunit SecG